MKSKILYVFALFLISLCGCTTVALRRNTSNQAKTVSDFLADQVLYNLALYNDFHEGVRVNGLPSFVTLSSGMATIAQGVNSTLTLKFTTGLSEEDPAATASHTTTDNWGFTPVIDPVQLTRLSFLYRAEFEEINSNEIATIFPSASPALDSQGRPFLNYTPKTDKAGNVDLDTKGDPIFIATVKPPAGPHKFSEIPGALGLLSNVVTNKNTMVITTNWVHGRIDGWFSFTPPTNMIPKLSVDQIAACRMGPYLNHYIWITNRENFLKFSLLALGGTNGYSAGAGGSSSPSAPLFINQNGLIKLY